MTEKTIAYLGTPYTRYAAGIEAAFQDAAALAARLLRSGIHVYSPIAHTHPLAIYGHLDPLDHSIWLPFDELMMRRCDTLIIAHMEGWQDSKGIRHEVDYFQRAGKPIFDLPDITTCTLVRRPDPGPPSSDRWREGDLAALQAANGEGF